MKFLKVIVVIVLLFIVFSLISVSFYLKYHGKYLLEDTLRIALNRDVSVGSISIKFPLGVSIRDLKVLGSSFSKGKNSFEVNKINVRLEFWEIFDKKIKIKELVLIDPYIFIEKKAKSTIKAKASDNKKDVQGEAKNEEADIRIEEKKEIKPLQIYAERMYIRNGVVEYIDSVSDKKIDFILNEFYLKLGNLYVPFKPSQISFDFRAIVAKANGPLLGSRAKGKGWIDIVKKDMEAQLELLEADGHAGLTANFVSKNNDMVVQGDINVDNFLLGLNETNLGENNIADKVFGALLSMGVEVGAHYSFRTKMDDIRINSVALTGRVGIVER